tara:strand:- start:385 stop:687 length:303 start_codon:yes stop_codon:yes gene_type:complete
MSNVEQEITDLVGEVLEDRVDDALSNHYDFQDMMHRVEALESENDSRNINEEDILLNLARLIIKDDPTNRVIVYQTHLDNLKKEIEDLKKALADKEEVNG